MATNSASSDRDVGGMPSALSVLRRAASEPAQSASQSRPRGRRRRRRKEEEKETKRRRKTNTMARRTSPMGSTPSFSPSSGSQNSPHASLISASSDAVMLCSRARLDRGAFLLAAASVDAALRLAGCAWPRHWLRVSRCAPRRPALCTYHVLLSCALLR